MPSRETTSLEGIFAYVLLIGGLFKTIFNLYTAGCNLISKPELTDSNVPVGHNDAHTSKVVGEAGFGVHGCFTANDRLYSCRQFC